MAAGRATAAARNAAAKKKTQQTPQASVKQLVVMDDADADGDGVLTEEEKTAFAEKARRACAAPLIHTRPRRAQPAQGQGFLDL